VGYLATAFVLIIIFVAFKLTARMDRRDEQKKDRAGRKKKP
jgi:ABC-type phosphate transport system permease subunit